MVTIKNSANETFTFQEGDVDTVTSRLSASPDADMMPGTAPLGVILIDFNGSKKTITMTGLLTLATSSVTDVSTTTTILAQKKWLEKLINGTQSIFTFTSTYETLSYDGSTFSSTTAMSTSITFTEQSGNPNKLDFTFEMVIGG